MDKSKRKNSEGKVYKPEGSRYWGTVVLLVFAEIILGISLLILVMSLWAIRSLDAIPFFMICGLFVFVSSSAFCFVYNAAEKTSIICSKEGLTYRRGTSYMFTEWQNLSHFIDIGFRFEIYLQEGIKPEVKSWLDKQFYGQAIHIIQIDNIVKVPRTGNVLWESWESTKVDLDAFKQTELGRDLLHYAPHLFGEKDKRDIDDDSYEILIQDEYAKQYRQGQ